MIQRFELRKRQLVNDAKITPQVYDGLLERLPVFLERFTASMRQRKQKTRMGEYLQGLLSDMERKNVETIAYLHDQERQSMQHFVGRANWGYKPMLSELTRQIGEELGEPDGVITIDPSGFEKDGTESVGVQRQWLGRFGKVDNGQVGVYLGYASRKGHALCDVRLYLPEDWARDKKRLRKCGVPKDIRFQTRHELAQSMLTERGHLLPHAWVTGDGEMGRSSRFRVWLRSHGERYLLAVPSNTTIRDLEAKPPVWSGIGAKPKRKYTTLGHERCFLHR